MERKDVIIVGAGLSGIMAARTLTELGVENVLLLEKSRSVGGRLATRRIGVGQADHGAQFFTAFTEPFRTHALSWQQSGWVKKWFGGTHSRFYSTVGMNKLAKQLSETLNVQLDTKVNSITEIDTGFAVYSDKGEFEAKAVIMTAPLPQSLEIVKNGGIALNQDVKELLEAVVFSPCLVVMLELNQPSKIDAMGYVDSKLPIGVERMIDNSKKGISDTPILSVYMTNQWSEEHFHLKDEEIIASIVEKISMKYLGEASILTSQLKKWRYSEATKVYEKLFEDAKLSHRLFFAGDAFISPKDPSKRARFESAALSGIAVGKELAKTLLK